MTLALISALAVIAVAFVASVVLNVFDTFAEALSRAIGRLG